MDQLTSTNGSVVDAAGAAMKATVKSYYGETLQTSSDLKTSACKTCVPVPPAIRDLLQAVPAEVSDKFYGCGTPLPLGVTGLRVLDLGCGSGRDCYVASRLVGETGLVTGVDMTPSQLDVAQRNSEQYSRDVCGFEKPNMRFIHGDIEYLDKAGIPDESHDIVISNCVINLSPDKPRVLREVYRVLSPGGEMYFSDVYCDRRLKSEIRTHPTMIGECLGGALYINDFLRICKQVGFTDPRVLSVEPISVDDEELSKVAGDAKFYSVTFRLFKVPGGLLEDLPEQYGQQAVYLGTLPGSTEQYELDADCKFPVGKSASVDGNTAAILSTSWLASHFTVSGNTADHLGQFVSRNSAMSLDDRLEAKKKLSSAAAKKGGCCGPASATAPKATATNGCCSPAAAPKAATGSCCGPKAAPIAAKGGCCPPSIAAASQAAASASKGCCGPKAVAPVAVAASASAVQPPGEMPAVPAGCCDAAPTAASVAAGGAGVCCAAPRAA